MNTVERRNEFAEVWNNAENPAHAAEQLGMKRASASVKASILRRAGYELKHFPKGAKKAKVAVES